MPLVARRMSTLGTENAFKLGADIARCVARGMRVVRLNLGEPDFDSAPHINDAAIDAIRAGKTHYCDPAGLPELRRAIAAHVCRTRALDVDPDRVVVTPGGKPSIGYAMQTYVDPGDEVIYPSPGFPIYESWISYVGARPVPLALRDEDDFAITPGALAQAITPRTKLIILNSPSNPTGGVLSRSELAALAEVIIERASPQVRVYSDEIYEHILFDGAAHHSIAAEPGMAERTIIASGHSKGFAMTGWRLGWAVLPTLEEAALFKQLNVNVVSCVPPFIQEAGRAALEDPASGQAVSDMVCAFQTRRDWVVDALRAIPGVRCRKPQGAFYVFPNVAGVCESLGITDAYQALPVAARDRTSPSTLLQRFLLERHGVATMDRSSFGRIGASGEHFLRLSIANSMDELREGVNRIAAAAADRAGCAEFLAAELAR
ncbi:MAG TPA: pyridoxal phosphate-dependent aminotransferase [Gemmatimonadaceae bacterium]|nr:pyridoxal phosphate-dependent aminotransferase [Gemmatimonadaceae bacterium]